MVRYLHLNTQYSSNESTTGPLWNLAKPIRVHSLRLLSANVPHSFYTVSESLSTSGGFSIQLSGASAEPIVLTPRIYNLTQLATEIQTRVLALGSLFNGFTCTADLNTLKLSMSLGSAYGIQISDPRHAALLGLVEGTNVPSFNVVSSVHACELSTSCLYFTSRQLGCSYFPSAGNNEQPAAAIVLPVTEDAGSVINWAERHQHEQRLRYEDPKTLQQISMEIRDSHGFVVDTNGLHWNLTFEYD